MRQVLSYFTFIFCLAVLIPSCKKYNNSAQNPQTIHVSIKADETYNYDLGFFGDEEGASINRQALHYDKSAIEINSITTKRIYNYRPESGYIGIDEVELKSERGSDGASPNDKINITIIQFTITH